MLFKTVKLSKKIAKFEDSTLKGGHFPLSMQLSTGVLFKENNNLVIIRGIEKETIEQIKSQYGKERCICYVGGQSVDYGPVKHALFWMEQVDIGD